MHKIAD